MKKNYSVGIVANPTKVGYSVIDDQTLHLVKLGDLNRHAIGVRKFDEAQAKADTRLLRVSRRTNRRKHARIVALNSVLKNQLLAEDPTFFDRMKQAGLSPLDKRKTFYSKIYPTPAMTSVIHKKYPTVYHIEKYLIETKDKADIHLIYEALHALLTNRGHFYDPTPLSQFKPGKVDIVSALARLNELFHVEGLKFNIDKARQIENILLDHTIFRVNKEKQIKKLLVKTTKITVWSRRNKKIATQVTNAFLGGKVQFDTLFLKDVSPEEAKDWSFKLNDLDVDEKLENISDSLSNDQNLIIEELQKVHSSVALADILQGHSTLYDAKIASYQKHKQDLKLYYKFIGLIDKAQGNILKEAYSLYINPESAETNWSELKKKWGENVPRNAESLYKVISPIIASIKTTRVDPADDDSDFKYSKQVRHYADVILNFIDHKDFLPKQRTSENIYIPYQLNALTFNAICKNQGKFYPELIEANPCKHDRKEAPYKLSQLMQFTIPYYVGPLVTEEEEKGLDDQHRHGWMIRKENGKITPWNFYDKVDVVASANEFIKRSIARDTYLLKYPVLPKNSLIYQKYLVFEELSNININDDDHFNASDKQWIYENVFKKHLSVSKKTLVRALTKANRMEKIKKISGFSDINHPKFLNALTTYYSFKKVFGSKIDDPKLEDDFEKIIEWSTVFEDRKILAVKLKEINWLNDKEKKFIIRNRLSGWGRFSKELLVGLKDKEGKTILQTLVTRKKNFIQIINQGVFQKQIDQIASNTAKQMHLEEILEASFASPADKKAIMQTVKVLDDIVRLNQGVAPTKIMLRFQRSKSENKNLTDSRDKKLMAIYSVIKKDAKKKENKGKIRYKLYNSDLHKVLKEKTKQSRNLTEKEYLYFQQLGRDALTGDFMDLNHLRDYKIVHIIPRSKLVDNSDSNLILTAKTQIKDSPLKDYGNKNLPALDIPMKQLWIEWHALGLISKGKLKHFQTDLNTIDKYQAYGYMARQLVETNQIAKLLSTILQARYPDTKIIEIRHDQIADVRMKLSLYRLPIVNDYYIGYDAFLASIIGNYLYTVYPKMRRLFVFGEYIKYKKDDKDKKVDNKNFNILWQLLYGRKNSDDIIASDDSKTAVYNRKELINYIKSVYNYKFQNVSYAVRMGSKKLFKSTLYPRLERDTVKTRTLIPKKKDLDPAIYGGYTSNVDYYFVFVETKNKKGKKEYKFYGVPSRFAQEMQVLTDERDRYEMLHKIVANQVSKNIKFRILKEKVPYCQLIEDGNDKYCMRSVSYRYNTRQLILPNEDLKVIMDTIVDPEFVLHLPTKDHNKNLSVKLDKVYADILYQVKHYLTAMHLNKLVEKLEKGQKLFAKLPIGKKIYVLEQLLTTTQCNSTTGKLNDIGIGAISMQKKNMPISENAMFVMQSPTGLRFSKVSVKRIANPIANRRE